MQTLLLTLVFFSIVAVGIGIEWLQYRHKRKIERHYREFKLNANRKQMAVHKDPEPAEICDVETTHELIEALKK